MQHNFRITDVAVSWYFNTFREKQSKETKRGKYKYNQNIWQLFTKFISSVYKTRYTEATSNVKIHRCNTYANTRLSPFFFLTVGSRRKGKEERGGLISNTPLGSFHQWLLNVGKIIMNIFPCQETSLFLIYALAKQLEGTCQITRRHSIALCNSIMKFSLVSVNLMGAPTNPSMQKGTIKNSFGT